MANRIQQAYNASKITKEVGDEIEELKEEAADRSWWQTLGSTLGGGLALTLLSGGTLNPLTLGALTAVGSGIGGAVFGNQRKISGDYEWAQGAADDIDRQLDQKLLSGSLESGLYAGLGQAKYLQGIDSEWGDLLDFSDTPRLSAAVDKTKGLYQKGKSLIPSLPERNVSSYGITATADDAMASKRYKDTSLRMFNSGMKSMMKDEIYEPTLIDKLYDKLLLQEGYYDELEDEVYEDLM